MASGTEKIFPALDIRSVEKVVVLAVSVKSCCPLSCVSYSGAVRG